MHRLSLDKALDSLFLAGDETGVTDLLLIQHAEAASPSSYDGPGLSDDGRRQARRLAESLTWSDLRALYSAGSAAALETAKFIGKSVRIEPETTAELAPIFISDLEESSLDETIERLSCDPRWDALPHAEAGRLFRRRVIQAIDSIAARHSGQTVAIVVHACAINAYLGMVLGIQRDLFFAPSPGSVSAVRIKGGRQAVRYINSDRPLRVHEKLDLAALTAR